MKTKLKTGDLVRLKKGNRDIIEVMGANTIGPISILIPDEQGFTYIPKIDYNKFEWKNYNVAYDKLIPKRKYSWVSYDELELVSELELAVIQIKKEVNEKE